MHLFMAILGALAAIFSVIIVHEWGHFVVARCVGIKVLRFSIGFGRPIWRYIGRHGTEYTLGWIPLGGFVKMLGERQSYPGESKQSVDTDIPPHAAVSSEENRVEDTKNIDYSQSYSAKPVVMRMAVVAAGPLINFVLAVLLFWLVFLGGMQQLRPVVGKVLPGSPAALAGFQSGDEIIALNGEETHNWQPVLMALLRRVGNTQAVKVTVKPSK